MNDKVVLFGLLTKNSGKWIEEVLKNVEKYASFFNDYKCLILDGNSTDTTANKCNAWCSIELSKRKFMQQPSNNLERGQSLTECRNFVVEHFKPFFGENVFLMLLDTDSPNAIPFSGFESCFSQQSKDCHSDIASWDALFANQRECYYDVWALRDEECPNDYQINARITGNWDVKHLQKPKPTALGFHPVKSAFGGAGIYKTTSIKNAKYYCKTKVKMPDNNVYVLPVCEHVPFNLDMIHRGCKLFVNCEWLIGDHE